MIELDVSEMVKDSLRYPFSDWKKILMLGIIVFISSVFYSLAYSFVVVPTVIITWFLGIVGLLIFFLSSGYVFRMIKSSLKLIRVTAGLTAVFTVDVNLLELMPLHGL